MEIVHLNNMSGNKSTVHKLLHVMKLFLSVSTKLSAFSDLYSFLLSALDSTRQRKQKHGHRDVI